MICRHSVIEKCPEPLIGLDIFSPPEPAAACLVERPPQNGDTAFLKLFELLGNNVDISYKCKALAADFSFVVELLELVVGKLCYLKLGGSNCLCNVKVCILSVILLIHRISPVPHIADKSALFAPLLCNLDICGYCIL